MKNSINLSRYVPMDRRQAMAHGTNLPNRVTGTALFADISGFTPLTNALVTAFGRRRGAEEVLRYINPVYEALVACLYQYRGSVISFAGDAITCWLEGDDGARGVACALAMQQVMQRFDVILLPDGSEISLAIKIALANGAARRFVVGDTAHQLFDALAGQTIVRMATAEGHATSGEIVASREIVTQLGQQIVVSEWRGGMFAVVTGQQTAVSPQPWPPLATDTLDETIVKQWQAPHKYGRSGASGDFLAELRPTTALFLSFAGLNYDEDDEAGSKLDNYLRWAQTVLAQYGGHVLQLTIGDKGSYIYANFGAFMVHDDDTARAVATALDLQRLPASLAYMREVKIGISQGMMWTGEIGSSQRCTYGAMGKEVNMSARLMSKAKAGQILVHQRVADLTADQYEFLPLGELKVKGGHAPLPAALALHRRTPKVNWLTSLFDSPLVGREEILATLQEHLTSAVAGQGQIVQIEGEAGIGKSHLTAVFMEQMAQTTAQIAVGACRSINQATPYTPWQQIMLSLFALDSYPLGDGVRRLMALLPTINENWAERLPVLGDLLTVVIEDNDTTANLDAQSRQEALISLVIEILQHQATLKPVLLLLEDVHWIDDASEALVTAVGQAMKNMPLFMLLIHRPPLSTNAPILPTLPPFPYRSHYPLTDLSLAGIEALLQYRLQASIEPLIVQFVQTRVQGNPFFAEELIDALREANYITLNKAGVWWFAQVAFDAFVQANCFEKVAGVWQFTKNPPLNRVQLNLPDSVHGTVLSRLDRLPEQEKLTLKVASVIGRVFSVALLEAIHPSRLSMSDLLAQIEVMSYRDFVRLETISDTPTYIFKHNITQEVAYSTLLFAQRRQLHKDVAVWYETAVGKPPHADEALTTDEALNSALAPHYAILYHHWHYAEEPKRERLYARLAGEQAAARYMNDQAIHYFTRALYLLPATAVTQQYQLLTAREKVYDLSGQREAQAEDLAQLSQLNQQLNDQTRAAQLYLRQANYQLGLSEYAEVIPLAQAALQQAATIEAAQQIEAEAYCILGRALRRQGEYEQAQARLQQLLTLPDNTSLGSFAADALLELGTINFYVGEYSAAEKYVQQAAEKYRTLNDRKGEAGSLMMMGVVNIHRGDYLAGQASYQQALQTCHTVGYRSGETAILGNMGVGYEYLGDYVQARACQEDALTICDEIGDQEGAAYCLTNLTNLYFWLADYDTAQLFGESGLALIEQLGDKRNEAYVLTYLGRVATAVGNLTHAQTYYDKAITIRRELGDDGGVIDVLAGLAEVAQAADNSEVALAHVDEVEAWLTTNGTHGVEYPLHVYLTLYHVLRQSDVDKKRPLSLLKTAYHLLQEQAANIQDEGSRHNFLEQVPFNREIGQLYRATIQ